MPVYINVSLISPQYIYIRKCSIHNICAFCLFLTYCHVFRCYKCRCCWMLLYYKKTINICSKKRWKMVDRSRSLRPLNKEYSFYSALHKLYSRIDLFVIDSTLLHLIKAVEFHNRLISDHSPLSMDLDLRVKGSYS